MPTASITKVETVKSGVNADLFDPIADPLTLRMTLKFSADVMKLAKPTMLLTYQLIEFQTDTVFEQWAPWHTIPGTSAYAWVDLPSVYSLGLTWIPCGIFGFRGAVEVYDNYSTIIDAFDVSGVHWFHVKPVFFI